MRIINLEAVREMKIYKKIGDQRIPMQRLLIKANLLVKRNLTDFLIVTPIINIVIFPFLLAIHWMTGEYGYAIGMFLFSSGLFLTYLIYMWLRPKRFGIGTVLSYLFCSVLTILIWHDFRFLILAINNHGLTSCPYGASCP